MQNVTAKKRKDMNQNQSYMKCFASLMRFQDIFLVVFIARIFFGNVLDEVLGTNFRVKFTQYAKIRRE